MTITTRAAKFLALTLCLYACNGTDPSALGHGAGKPSETASAGLLVLSQVAGADISPEPLCDWPFEDGVPLFPVTGQPHQLYFYHAPKGISVVRVMAGGALCRFMLRTKGQHLEVLTSKQFPLCLSNQVHFRVQSNTIGFDGGKYIRFQMAATPEAQGFRCTLSWEAEKELGFTVRHTNLTKADKSID